MSLSARILVVDDSNLIRQFVARELAADGHTVLEARHGLEALEIARHDDGIDLVITDLNMPIMGGLDLVRELRRLPHLNSTRLCFLTTETSGSMRRLGLEAGADAWMEKPFRMSQLRETIGALLTVR
jgi:two-component system, chemotaxis family, chemotaxis protein CheY